MVGDLDRSSIVTTTQWPPPSFPRQLQELSYPTQIPDMGMLTKKIKNHYGSPFRYQLLCYWSCACMINAFTMHFYAWSLLGQGLVKSGQGVPKCKWSFWKQIPGMWMFNFNYLCKAFTFFKVCRPPASIAGGYYALVTIYSISPSATNRTSTAFANLG